MLAAAFVEADLTAFEGARRCNEGQQEGDDDLGPTHRTTVVDFPGSEIVKDEILFNNKHQTLKHCKADIVIKITRRERDKQTDGETERESERQTDRKR